MFFKNVLALKLFYILALDWWFFTPAVSSASVGGGHGGLGGAGFPAAAVRCKPAWRGLCGAISIHKRDYAMPQNTQPRSEVARCGSMYFGESGAGSGASCWDAVLQLFLPILVAFLSSVGLLHIQARQHAGWVIKGGPGGSKFVRASNRGGLADPRGLAGLDHIAPGVCIQTFAGFCPGVLQLLALAGRWKSGAGPPSCLEGSCRRGRQMAGQNEIWDPGGSNRVGPLFFRGEPGSPGESSPVW